MSYYRLMRHITVILFILALMSAILAFGNISETDSSVARFIFFIFISASIISGVLDLKNKSDNSDN